MEQQAFFQAKVYSIELLNRILRPDDLRLDLDTAENYKVTMVVSDEILLT